MKSNRHSPARFGVLTLAGFSVLLLCFWRRISRSYGVVDVATPVVTLRLLSLPPVENRTSVKFRAGLRAQLRLIVVVHVFLSSGRFGLVRSGFVATPADSGRLGWKPDRPQTGFRGLPSTTSSRCQEGV